jgi:hypothetical protein
MKNKLSLVALLVCMSTMLYSGFVFYPKWEKSGGEATLSWDVSGYYMYLPALFIYKDLKQVNFLDSVRAKYQFTPNSQQVFQHSSGNKVMKYPIGQALVMLPAFGIAHAISSNSDAVTCGWFFTALPTCHWDMVVLLGLARFNSIPSCTINLF